MSAATMLYITHVCIIAHHSWLLRRVCLQWAGRRKAGTAAAAADAAAQKPLHERVDDLQRRRQEKLLAACEVSC
jgi:hypothetical protein